MQNLVSFLTKKRKGSTLFLTLPILLGLVSLVSFVVYDVYQEVEASYEPSQGIEVELDEYQCLDHDCWFT